jgi:hypothetical protein
VNISFGVTNYGSIGGRVFNDVSQKGDQAVANLPGVAGVRVILHPTSIAGPSLSMTVDGGGNYQFRYLPPGSYTLEIDPATLPADFRLPHRTSWPFTVAALQSFYLDIPLEAQRAISGVVFIDKDANGKFDPERDEPVEGAHVITGPIEVISGKSGSYILRGLPAGRLAIRTRTALGTESQPIIVELGVAPVTRRGLNLAVLR